jgi:predicted hydrocarbon binding protein/DNA-binding HxlR family transcriptional regulator
METIEQYKETNKQKPIQIFSKGHKEIGVNVIKSPVKLVILSMLKDGDMEFDEIVKNTGKSKSTVSVHLKALREDGIISFKLDPDDQRKKIFYITSRFLGEIDAPEPLELEERKVDFLLENIINKNNSNSFEFSQLLFHTFRASLIQEGMNINPILYETGKKMGFALYEQYKDDDFDVFLKNIQKSWVEYGLGNVEFETEDLIKVTVSDCLECMFLPKSGKPTCYLDKGILEAIFSSYLNKDLMVIETICTGMGDSNCVFEIEFLE